MSTTTSSQPMALSPIITQRTRSDSNGMGSPTSILSGYSAESAIDEEREHTIAASTAHLVPTQTQIQSGAARRNRLQHVQTTDSRRSSESVDSLGRPRFNDLGRGRHSTQWLFRGFSFRETVGKLVNGRQ